jgi:hypothetical protein
MAFGVGGVVAIVQRASFLLVAERVGVAADAKLTQGAD